MQLEIKDNTNLLDEKFAQWLIECIKGNIILNLDTKRFLVWDEYLNEKEIFKTTYLKSINTLSIVFDGIQNLVFNIKKPYIRISINPKLMVNGLDRVSLETFCTLVNYGDLSLNGYPIFSDAFREVEENFNDYIDRYINEPI